MFGEINNPVMSERRPMAIPGFNATSVGKAVPGLEIVVARDDDPDELPVLAQRLIAALARRNAGRLSREVFDGPSRSSRADEDAILLDKKLVEIRGLHDPDPSVLVDGRPVAGGIVDLALLLSEAVDELRVGECSFTVAYPEPATSSEEAKWAHLIEWSEDRLGVERGTVRSVSLTGFQDHSTNYDEVAVA